MTTPVPHLLQRIANMERQLRFVRQLQQTRRA